MTTAQTVMPNKREGLIEAARLAFSRQGFATTTLADVAALAEVPMGTVYYYVRTKDDLLAAVIDAYLRELRAWFARWEGDPDPRRRLLSLPPAGREGQDELARYGCPYGSLCQDLGRGDTPLATLAAQLFEAHIDWRARQVRLMGKDAAEAREVDDELIAAPQGAFPLASSFRSAALLERQLERPHTWIESL